MKALLARNINRLAEQIFRHVIHTFSGASMINDLAEHEYKSVKIAPNVRLTFQKWGKDLRKPYFIILWRRSRYVMEFDLSRAIYTTNDKLTWILNIPTRDKNKNNLLELGYKIKKIDSKIVENIYKQMSLCNKLAKRTPKGYILAWELPIDNVIDKFIEIIEYTIKSDQQQEIESELNSDNEDINALEGQISESKVLGRKRNRAVVDQRKIIDHYTCQACNFCIQVNGRYVIECHHKFPLRGETITSSDDLVCLCPTCHRIAHRKAEPYTATEIKSILAGKRGR